MRDSLTYRASGLEPIVQLASESGESGEEFYRWESPEGSSIQRSVDYLVPYAMGRRTHAEWVNTQVPLDRERAAAGLEECRPGRLYEPSHALPLMELATFLDPNLQSVVDHLRGPGTSRFPAWQSLINEAARPPAD